MDVAENVRNPPPSIPSRDDAQNFRRVNYAPRAALQVTVWDRIMTQLSSRARAEQVRARRRGLGHDYNTERDIEMIDEL